MNPFTSFNFIYLQLFFLNDRVSNGPDNACVFLLEKIEHCSPCVTHTLDCLFFAQALPGRVPSVVIARVRSSVVGSRNDFPQFHPAPSKQITTVALPTSSGKRLLP